MKKILQFLHEIQVSGHDTCSANPRYSRTYILLNTRIMFSRKNKNELKTKSTNLGFNLLNIPLVLILRSLLDFSELLGNEKKYGKT